MAERREYTNVMEHTNECCREACFFESKTCASDKNCESFTKDERTPTLTKMFPSLLFRIVEFRFAHMIRIGLPLTSL
jgi:hypothetical protein